MKTLASSGEAEVEVSSGRERLAGTARCRVTTAPLYIDGALKAASPLRRYRTALGRVPEAAQSLWNRLGAYTDREACLGDEMRVDELHMYGGTIRNSRRACCCLRGQWAGTIPEIRL